MKAVACIGTTIPRRDTAEIKVGARAVHFWKTSGSKVMKEMFLTANDCLNRAHFLIYSRHGALKPGANALRKCMKAYAFICMA
jgi:hypothetical protein